jgi:Uma2 family endonuclease
MKTLLRIGPRDHGRPITDGELRQAEFVTGYKYELIDGRSYVTYEPDLPEDSIEHWPYVALLLYSRRRPKVINYVTDKARVIIPGEPRSTVPEPDLAAYHDFALHIPLRKRSWRKVSPLLVGEILSPNDPHKDLIRNVELYIRAPTIQEYWVLDGRPDPDRPTMLVYRRCGQDWQAPVEVSYGETYRYRLLPGFKLLLDPRR